MRPKKCRQVKHSPKTQVFKPKGIPFSSMETVELGRDELEAIRLVDVMKCYQEEACKEMGISRSTIGRLLSGARRKIGDALLNGKGIIIQPLESHIKERGVTEPID